MGSQHLPVSSADPRRPSPSWRDNAESRSDVPLLQVHASKTTTCKSEVLCSGRNPVLLVTPMRRAHCNRRRIVGDLNRHEVARSEHERSDLEGGGGVLRE